MEGEPKEHGNTKYSGLHEAIIKNESVKGLAGYKPIEELAQEYGTTVRYLYRVRKILRDKGLLKRGFQSFSGKAEHHGYLGKLDPEELIKVIENEPILGPLDRIKILSRLVRTGTPALKIQAIKTLEDLSRVSEQRVGPPSPMTRDDRVARLSRLMLAVGEETVAMAHEVTFGYKPQKPLPSEEALQPGPDDLLQPSDQAAESLRDLFGPSPSGPQPERGPLPQDGQGPGPAL